MNWNYYKRPMMIAVALTFAFILFSPTGQAQASHETPFNQNFCAQGFTQWCLHDGNNDDSNLSNRNGSQGPVVAFYIEGTENQQLWAGTPYMKYVEFSIDDLCAPTTLSNNINVGFIDLFGNPISVVHQGNGFFTGLSDYGDFFFNRPDVINMPGCGPDATSIQVQQENRAKVLGINACGAASFGFAILSDIETFFLIEALECDNGEPVKGSIGFNASTFSSSGIAITGDWNGDGTPRKAVYIPSTATVIYPTGEAPPIDIQNRVRASAQEALDKFVQYYGAISINTALIQGRMPAFSNTDLFVHGIAFGVETIW